MSYFDDNTYGNDNLLSAAIQQFVDDSRASSSVLREEVWPRGYKHYHGIHDPSMFGGSDALPVGSNKSPLDSAVFRNLTHYEVENTVARMRPAILNADPPWRCVPFIDDVEFCDKDMVWKYAESVQHLLHNQWHREVKAPWLIGSALREALLYGTCVLRVEWMRRFAPRWRQIPHVDGIAYPDGVPDDIREKGGKRTWAFGKLANSRPVEDRIRVNIVPLWNWFPDPYGRSIDGENDTQPMRGCAEMLVMPDDALVDWILSSPRRGWNKEFYKRNGEINEKKLRKMLEEVRGGITANDDWIKKQQIDAGKLSTDGYGTTSANERLVRIYAWSENWPEPRYILSAGKAGAGLTLLDESGDKHPGLLAGIGYVLVKPIPLANELFGLSKTEQLAGVQHEMNMLVNLRISALSRSISGITIISTQGGLHAKDFLAQPGGFVELNGYYDPAKQAHHIDFKDPGANIYREVDELRNDGTLTFGNTDFMMGSASDQAANTARGVSMAVEQGTVRQTMEAEQCGLCFCQLGEKILALDEQFITGPKYVRIAGKKGADAWEVVDPDMIGTRFELTFDTRPVVANPALQEQKFVNFAQLWGQAQGFPVGLAMRTHAKMARIPEAEQYGGPPVNDAEWENIEFLKSGTFRGVLPADAHEFHQSVMSRPEIMQAAQSLGAEAVGSWNAHYEQHEQFKQGAMQQGAMQQGAGAPPEPQAPPEQSAPPPEPLPPQGLNIPTSQTSAEIRQL